MDRCNIFSGELKFILFCFNFIRQSFDFLLSFVFWNGPKAFDVIINVCCCCLIPLFVSTRFLNIGISHQSSVSFFLLQWVVCLGGFSFIRYFFEKNTWVFGFLYLFLYLSSFGRKLCQKCGWAGSELYVWSHITELVFKGQEKINQLWKI